MRKVKWGILGTAMICERDTIPGMLLADNVELTAIAGRSKEKVDRFQTQYGFKKTYYSYEDLLADEEIEAVYIPLPNTMHYEWTIKALQHKKHVLCEKPLAPTAKEAQEMFAAARENGVYLMEAFAYQHSPIVATLRDEVAGGTLGKINYMSTYFLTSSYDISNIRMRRETKGGSLYDLGVYNASLLLRVLDETPVSAVAVAKYTDEKIDVLTHAILEYASGITADLTSGMILENEENRALCRFEIDGSNASITSDNFMFNGLGQLSYIITDKNGNSVKKVIDVPHNYKLEVEQLGRCITDGETPLVSEEFSVANAKTIDMILKAMQY